MTKIESIILGLVLIALLAVGSYAFGWHRGYAAAEEKWQAEKAQMIADAKAKALQLESEGNRLRAELEVARANVRVEYVEVIREIRKVASASRRAVGADLTRMLNRLSGIRETVEPAGPGGAAAPGAEAPADPGRSAGTSERALAEWIAGAVRSHEECRAQANALIDYARACSR